MAVRQRGLLNTFNKYKKQGLSDTAAMEKAIADSSAATIKSVASEKKAREKGVISRTKKRLKSLFGPGHSPAGKKYLKAKKQKALMEEAKSWSKPKKKKRKK